MAYVTQTEIEEYTGFAYSDFKIGGRTMTEAEWDRFLADLIPRVTQIMHRYCNVPSFEATQIVELHSGRGASDLDAVNADYIPSDTDFYLRNLYLTNGTYAAVVVQEDMAAKTSAPSWVTRTVRSAGGGGDYEVISERELTKVVFHDNIPLQGRFNVKLTYYTGYDSTSEEFKDLKLQVLRLMMNALLLKKKVQEATTIRNVGVRDYSQMFDVFNESSILSETSRHYLEKYRRYPLPTSLYD